MGSPHYRRVFVFDEPPSFALFSLPVAEGSLTNSTAREAGAVRFRRYRIYALRGAAVVAVAALCFATEALEEPNSGGPSAPFGCFGDCDASGAVTVNDIIVGVNIALGNEVVSACSPFDTNDDEMVTVDELLAAVAKALDGCPPQTPVQRGLASLAVGDFRSAKQRLADAVAADPGNDEANLYLAFARLAATLLDDQQFQSLADRAGVTITGNSTHICGFDIELPDIVPPDAPRTSEILATASAVLLPALDASLNNLAAISPEVAIEFDTTNLPICLQSYTDRSTIEVTRADVLMLMAGLNGAKAALNAMQAYDLDLDLQTVIDGPTPAAVAAAPNLLTLRSPDRLTTARQLFDLMLSGVSQAVDLLPADGAEDHVLGILVGDAKTMRTAKRLVDLVRQSLTGEVALPLDVVTGEVVLLDIGLLQAERLNLGPLFSGQFTTLRPWLPGADLYGDFDLHQFADPTFGNTTPDLTQDKIDNFLSGGPPCAACATDSDCDAYGFGEYLCMPCVDNCTGESTRCAPEFDVVTCVDGSFGWTFYPWTPAPS